MCITTYPELPAVDGELGGGGAGQEEGVSVVEVFVHHTNLPDTGPGLVLLHLQHAGVLPVHQDVLQHTDTQAVG